MHPTATRCVRWATALLVVGAVLLAYGSTMFAWLSALAGANAQVGLHAVNLGLTLVNAAAFPVAAALIGAAVVIQVLASERPRPHGEPDDSGSMEPGDPPATTTRPS